MESKSAEKGFQDLLHVFLFLVLGILGFLFFFLVGALILFRFFPRLFYQTPKFKWQRRGKKLFIGASLSSIVSSLFFFLSDASFKIHFFFNSDFLVPLAFPFLLISFQALIIAAIFWRTGGRLFRSTQGSKIISLDLIAQLNPEDFQEINSISKNSLDAPIGISLLDGIVAQYPFVTRNYHLMVVGGSGFGKTTLMKTFFVNGIYQKQPIVFIDPKGSSDNLNEIRKFALDHGVPPERFFVFSLPHPEASCFYNPIKNAETTAKKDRIMEAFHWSEQFYQSCASDYLTLLMPILELFKLGDVTLGDVRQSLTDEEFLPHLRQIFLEIATAPGVEQEFKERCHQAAQQVEKLKDFEGVEGLKSQLVTLEQSDYGYLFSPEKEEACHLGNLWREKKKSPQKKSTTPEILSEKGFLLQKALKEAPFLKKRGQQKDHREIDLADVIEKGGFVYFQISMMQTPDTSRRIARVILEDLKGVAHLIQTHQLKRPSLCSLFIDEFGEFATEEFGILLEQVRDAKLAVHLFFQSFGNLEKVSPTFRRRMEASSAEKIFLSTLSAEDAENAANLCGTEDAVEQSRQTVGLLGWSIPTGMGNQRFTKQMRVEHDVFKRLRIGQAVLLRKFPESRVDLVQIWNPDLSQRIQPGISPDEIRQRKKREGAQFQLRAGHGNFKKSRAWD